MVEATISSDGVEFALCAHEYQYAHPRSESDAQWIRGDARLAGGWRGCYSARREVWLYAPELALFSAALQDLTDAGAGNARMLHIEGKFGATITRDDVANKLTAFLQEPAPGRGRRGDVTLRFEAVEIDDDAIHRARDTFVALTRAFPVRGGSPRSPGAT